MHAIFIPYGIKECVDLLAREMQSQKFKLNSTSPDGQQQKGMWIQGSLRILPFGVWEYIFPKEYMDLVLTTLRFQPSENKNTKGKRFNYDYISPLKVNILRKMLKASKIPKFKTDLNLIWIMQHVSIIPIGIREDGDILEPVTNPEIPLWKHEAI